MGIRISWFRTLRIVGRAAHFVEGRALDAHNRRRARELAALGIFDGPNFGGRLHRGGLIRWAQSRDGWWREVHAAAKAEGAHSILVRTDQVGWMLRKIDAATDSDGANQ